jgi:hypothetical protein
MQFSRRNIGRIWMEKKPNNYRFLMYTKEIIIFLLRLRNHFQVQRKKYTPKSYMDTKGVSVFCAERIYYTTLHMDQWVMLELVTPISENRLWGVFIGNMLLFKQFQVYLLFHHFSRDSHVTFRGIFLPLNLKMVSQT